MADPVAKDKAGKTLSVGSIVTLADGRKAKLRQISAPHPQPMKPEKQADGSYKEVVDYDAVAWNAHCQIGDEPGEAVTVIVPAASVAA